MSDKLRMTDVFRGKVVVDSSCGKVGGGCVEIGDDDGWIAHFGYSGDFTTQDSNDMATYAAQAINNHDTMQDQITQLESTQEEYAHLLNDIHSMMSKSWRHDFSQKESGDVALYVSVLLETIGRERAAREQLEKDKAELVEALESAKKSMLGYKELMIYPLSLDDDLKPVLGVLAKHKGDK